MLVLIRIKCFVQFNCHLSVAPVRSQHLTCWAMFIEEGSLREEVGLPPLGYMRDCYTPQCCIQHPVMAAATLGEVGTRKF